MRGSVSYCALLAGLVAAPGLAHAGNMKCPNVVAGVHAFAGAGETCVAPGGAYAPTATGTTILPFNDPGYGFVTYGGGQLTTARAVTITTPDNAGADAVRSTGASSLITLTNGTALTTYGDGANGVQADAGGAVTLGGTWATTTVTTTGNSAYAYYATGAGSSISATNVVANVASSTGPTVLADQSATMTITGGSITTTGRYLNNVQANNSASITLTGTALSASGNGANALWTSNGGAITGTNLTITSSGGVDTATAVSSGGAFNGGYGAITSGGLLRLSNSTISITGPSGYGVGTADGGITTLTSDIISLTNAGAGGYGVQSGVGGQTTINGGAVTTSGVGAFGVQATGGGALLTTASCNDVGLTITTSGANAEGARADNGGVIALHGGSVTTSGASAVGLYATGANSVIDANGVAITTSGGGQAIGVYAYNNAAITIGSGTTIKTTGDSADAVVAGGGGGATLSGGTVAATGLGSGGLVIVDAGSTLTATNVRVTTTGAIDASDGYHPDAVYNGPSPGGASGGIAKLTDVTASTAAAGAFTVSTGAGGLTTYLGGAIASTGANAGGVISFNGGATVIGLDPNGLGTTIATTGVNSTGVLADTGAHVSLNGGSVTTSGAGALGLYATGANSVVTATNVAVSTSGGDFANAMFAENGGTIITNGGSAATAGADVYVALATPGGTLKLRGTSITATGLGAGGIGLNGSTASLTGANLTIVTHGDFDAANSFGAAGLTNQGFGQNTGGGVVSLTNSTIATTGSQAIGAANLNSGLMTITGGAITTSGVQSSGILTASGATTNLTGVQITTSGDGAKALSVIDAGTTLSGSNLTVSTSGTAAAADSQANALYNGAGGGSAGASAGGGAVALTGSALSTSGGHAHGAVTENNGSTTLTRGSVTTTGTQSDAVFGSSGGVITLVGERLTTSGDASKGIDVEGAGTQLTGSRLTISTSGTIDAATGFHAQGVYNGSSTPATVGQTGGGIVTLTDSSVTTHGVSSYGVDTANGGSTTFVGGSISTSGSSAIALIGADGASVTVGKDSAGQATTIATTGASAAAVAATSGASVSLTGATITASGAGSAGVTVRDADTTATLTSVAIATSGGVDLVTGDHADAVYNGPGATGSSGGTLALTGVVATTSGAGAYGVSVGAGGATTVLGGAVTTSGEAAYGAAVIGGGVLQLGGGLNISTSGAGAHGLYVAGPGAGATLAGPVTINVSGANAAGIYVASGAAVGAKGPLAVNAATYGLYIDGSASHPVGPTAIGLGGPLTLKTTDPSGAAITLSGNQALFAGAGGGVIDAAGTAIALLDGDQQTAAFVNYQINAPRIIYADPSTASVTFDNTTANAGSGDLAQVAGGSELTLTALASSLTGVIQTEAGSLSNVSLSGGSNWTITGNSTVTNLSLVNASAGFAPTTDGAFHTLTVTNFIGQGASLTLNAALGGTEPGADKLVINGGQATGATTINIRTIGNLGAATSGLGVPLVLTTNGGSIASDAFALAGPVTVGGYTYSLQSEDDGEYLVSSQALSGAQASGSLSSLAQSRQSQAIASRVLTSILTGATEQINCSSCSSGFASIGSFAIGAHGRWTLSPSLALLGGVSYDRYSAKGVTVNNSLLAAVGLRYDMVQLGKYRPFFEAGLAVSPYANVSFNRGYASSSGAGSGVGDTLSRAVSVYGRAGYIWRLTPKDEAAAYTSFTRSWQSTGGYLEGATAGNPFGALVLPSLDTMNIAEVGAQYTHLFGQHIEANVSAGYAFAFDANYGSDATISGFGAASGAAATSFGWAELGGRLSYRFSKRVTADAFVLGTLGAEPAGNQIHGGLALRMAF